MSRVKSGLIKKVACAFTIAALSIPMTVSGHAATDDNLYFGALDETLAQNVKTTVVEKGEFYITGAVQASLDFTSNRWVYSNIKEGTVHFQEFLVGQGDLVKKGDPIAEISVTVDEIEKEEVDINQKQDFIASYITSHKKCSFRNLLSEQRTKMEVIVTFMVILELIKTGNVEVSQSEAFGDIDIELKKPIESIMI